jgi:hypothetical protein
MTLHDIDLEHVQQRVEELAGELYEAREELALLKADFEIRGRALTYATKRWLEAEVQRDRARDLAARLAAKQPLRPVPDSLAEAVLGAECAVWIDGPGND